MVLYIFKFLSLGNKASCENILFHIFYLFSHGAYLAVDYLLLFGANLDKFNFRTCLSRKRNPWNNFILHFRLIFSRTITLYTFVSQLRTFLSVENKFLYINLWFSRVHNFLDDNLILVLTSRKISNALKLKKKVMHITDDPPPNLRNFPTIGK